MPINSSLGEVTHWMDATQSNPSQPVLLAQQFEQPGSPEQPQPARTAARSAETVRQMQRSDQPVTVERIKEAAGAIAEEVYNIIIPADLVRLSIVNHPLPTIPLGQAGKIPGRVTNLAGENLSGLNLSGTFPRLVNFQGANLSNTVSIATDFAGSDLQGANLTGAILIAPGLMGTDLRGIDFSRITLLFRPNLRWAVVTAEQVPQLVALLNRSNPSLNVTAEQVVAHFNLIVLESAADLYQALRVQQATLLSAQERNAYHLHLNVRREIEQQVQAMIQRGEITQQDIADIGGFGQIQTALHGLTLRSITTLQTLPIAGYTALPERVFAVDQSGNPVVAAGANADLSGMQLAGRNLQSAQLQRANLAEALLLSTNLREANLSQANLQGASLYGANLNNADLVGANLTSAVLGQANLAGADLSNASLNGAYLVEAYGLESATINQQTSFDGAYVSPQVLNALANKLGLSPEQLEMRDNLRVMVQEGQSWRMTLYQQRPYPTEPIEHPLLARIRLWQGITVGRITAEQLAQVGTDLLAQADMDAIKILLEQRRISIQQLQALQIDGYPHPAQVSGRVRLAQSNLIAMDLSGKNLSQQNLSESLFMFSNLSRADLGQADLSGANLLRANLHGANLVHANLTDVSLRYANLQNADLRHAELDFVDLIGANMQGAQVLNSVAQRLFRNGKITQAQLEQLNRIDDGDEDGASGVVRRPSGGPLGPDGNGVSVKSPVQVPQSEVPPFNLSQQPNGFVPTNDSSVENRVVSGLSLADQAAINQMNQQSADLQQQYQAGVAQTQAQTAQAVQNLQNGSDSSQSTGNQPFGSLPSPEAQLGDNWASSPVSPVQPITSAEALTSAQTVGPTEPADLSWVDGLAGDLLPATVNIYLGDTTRPRNLIDAMLTWLVNQLPMDAPQVNTIAPENQLLRQQLAADTLAGTQISLSAYGISQKGDNMLVPNTREAGQIVAAMHWAQHGYLGSNQDHQTLRLPSTISPEFEAGYEEVSQQLATGQIVTAAQLLLYSLASMRQSTPNVVTQPALGTPSRATVRQQQPVAPGIKPSNSVQQTTPPVRQPAQQPVAPGVTQSQANPVRPTTPPVQQQPVQQTQPGRVDMRKYGQPSIEELMRVRQRPTQTAPVHQPVRVPGN